MHWFLVGALALQLGTWALRHRSIEECTQKWIAGSTRERLDAAHILLNRGAASGNGLGPDLASRLLAGGDEPRIRRLALSGEVCKLADPAPQLAAVIDGLERGRPAALIDFVLQCRKVGGVSLGASSAMRRRELIWYFEAQREDAWPAGVAEQINLDLAPWLEAIRAYLKVH